MHVLEPHDSTEEGQAGYNSDVALLDFGYTLKRFHMHTRVNPMYVGYTSNSLMWIQNQCERGFSCNNKFWRCYTNNNVQCKFLLCIIQMNDFFSHSLCLQTPSLQSSRTLSTCPTSQLAIVARTRGRWRTWSKLFATMATPYGTPKASRCAFPLGSNATLVLLIALL